MATKTKAEKAAEAAAKKPAAKGAKKLGGGVAPVTEEYTITEAYLNAHPDLAQQGFTVGQMIEVPVGSIPGVVPKVSPEKGAAREPLDEATMSAEVKTITVGKKSQNIWYVKIVEEGLYRLYNEMGQAVSPIVSDPLQINKAASRANALNAAKLR